MKKRTGNRTLSAFYDTIFLLKEVYHMSYFTTNCSLFLVPSNTCHEEFKKINVFLEVLEESKVGEIINQEYLKTKKSCSGRIGYDIFQLFAVILYCFTKFKGSLREIEELCQFDMRIMYIMGQETPSYKVICEFINKYIVPHQYEIFVAITQTIIKKFDLDMTDQYLDGTKIEANANKYKFVWKPTTYHKNLDKKIRDLLNAMGFDIKEKRLIESYKLYQLINEYVFKENIDISVIPSGKGKRLTKQQRNYKNAYKYLSKLLDYEEKEKICGEKRNSYYKTDHDATAMALKTDYYSGHGSNMHAAYNIQVMVSSGLITMYGVFQDRTDYHTFIPMNDLYYKYYNRYPLNECADSGYGIFKNYKYMKEHNIGNYVKFQQWNGETSGKRPQLFFTFPDGVMCLDTYIGEEIPFDKNHHQRNKDGKLYKFAGCNDCGYAYKCKKNLKNKNEDYRIVELIPNYELLKEEARENLLSPKGIEIRINRSIQVEGAFGQIKQNMQYIRIRRRGIKKVSCEIMLMCLGKNIRKLFTFLESNKIESKYWKAPSDLKKEEISYPKKKAVRN